MAGEVGDAGQSSWLVLKDKSTSTKAIYDWLAERVSRHKRLDGGIVALDAIPKNPSGKILRKELRDLAKREQKESGKEAGRARL